MQIIFNIKEINLYFAISIFWDYKISLLFDNDEHDSSFVVIKNHSSHV
jgi:hypothetical protein